MAEFVAGIDLGGTTIIAAVSTTDGTIVSQDTVPTQSHEGPLAVLDRIAALVARLGKQTNASMRSVGMGVPGLVDVTTGVTRFLPNLPTQWRDVPVSETLSSRLNCSVHLLNDVRTATLAELRFGHGRGQPDITLAFFSLGTGVGGEVVIDGKLRLGPLGGSRGVGHQTICRMVHVAVAAIEAAWRHSPAAQPSRPRASAHAKWDLHQRCTKWSKEMPIA